MIIPLERGMRRSVGFCRVDSTISSLDSVLRGVGRPTGGLNAVPGVICTARHRCRFNGIGGLRGYSSRGLLVHVNLVAVQVLERHPRAVGLNLRLAKELDAGILHPAILAEAVIRHNPEEWL